MLVHRKRYPFIKTVSPSTPFSSKLTLNSAAVLGKKKT